MSKNYRRTDAAELAADIALLFEPLPATATEWHHNAQATDLEAAQDALEVINERGGVAWRGQDDDGVWYLTANMFRPASLQMAAQAIIDAEYPEGSEVLDKSDFRDDYNDIDEGLWADAASDADRKASDDIYNLLLEAGLSATVFLHHDGPGDIRVMDAALI